MADAEVASEVSSAFSNMDMDEVSNLRPSDSASQVSAAASSSPITSDSSSSKRKRRITRSDIWLYCREGREEDREAIHHGSGLLSLPMESRNRRKRSWRQRQLLAALLKEVLQQLRRR